MLDSLTAEDVKDRFREDAPMFTGMPYVDSVKFGGGPDSESCAEVEFSYGGYTVCVDLYADASLKALSEVMAEGDGPSVEITFQPNGVQKVKTPSDVGAPDALTAFHLVASEVEKVEWGDGVEG